MFSPMTGLKNFSEHQIETLKPLNLEIFCLHDILKKTSNVNYCFLIPLNIY